MAPTTKYPPYMDAYNAVPKVLDEIKKASVPPKFTLDFLASVLGLGSSSYRAIIPILKKLEFLDQASVPTNIYKEYRDDTKSSSVLGVQVKKAYADLYKTAEYAHKLSKDALTTKLKTLLGVGDDDKIIPKVVATFQEFVKLSKFDGPVEPVKNLKVESENNSDNDVNEPVKPEAAFKINKAFGISYTINLNLPATTEIEVYNSIFKALKDNLLDE
ncbi:DUF5343 domain-containing protein [Mucilaginibacter sp. KACC 22063]|uniref:DUF5343 domain-containing protein n=1 Tax=Mucilaginibacter sp. KACC 22063 TaxID=3025666 RepID=UPI00236551ED|nr:DUF5343 domain-containing protein [Mucilaginibacter sp. KACC 22063]WDF54351.1 DUF5343 domain-containing protein [Mucilaginibacter sp. KACC 22063]